MYVFNAVRHLTLLSLDDVYICLYIFHVFLAHETSGRI